MYDSFSVKSYDLLARFYGYGFPHLNLNAYVKNAASRKYQYVQDFIKHNLH